jgi:hypothetical protein
MQSDNEHCNHGPFVQICFINVFEYLQAATGRKTMTRLAMMMMMTMACHLHNSAKIQADKLSVVASITSNPVNFDFF